MDEEKEKEKGAERALKNKLKNLAEIVQGLLEVEDGEEAKIEEDVRFKNVEDIEGYDEFYRNNDRIYLTNLALHNSIAMPTMNPVHPRPDLRSYVPEEHF